MTIINDNSRVVNKLEASLTDNARVIIYDRHMFIVQATDCPACFNELSYQKSSYELVLKTKCLFMNASFLK